MVDEGHAVAPHGDDTYGIRTVTRPGGARDTARRSSGSPGSACARACGARRGASAPWTAAVAERAGLRLVGWDVDTHDWRGDSAEEMLERIAPDLFPGAVVLAHDGLGPGARRSGCAETVALIPPLVARPAAVA